MHLNGEQMKKMILGILLKPKSLFSRDIFEPNETMADFLPNGQGHSYRSPIDKLKHIFSDTTWPSELIFIMKTTYNSLAKIDTNCSGNMTKMATTPIYCKYPFKYLLLWNQKANGLGT